ncbi:cell envelope integrity protein TolA [Vibrio quintilis]|uniref:TonB C-terminal domain-containing protein n=1 Tax=Vibrio quintilis TaxID=1117707 RepID=A0A1M7YT76_9VIBR|nr:cell envelope integrity protein TolA [Vibrio quintilis]SHO55736.1 hypothetical protein VQ7734_01482 [Vibrio quintilis]
MKYFVALVIGLILSGCSGIQRPVCNDANSCGVLIRDRIQHHLFYDDAYRGMKASVRFEIDSTTNVAAYQVLESDGTKSFGMAVKAAVYQSFPYPALQNISPAVFEEIKEVTLNIRL